MTHKTRGIVLRIVKYGETSIIATVYTGLFGMQSYLINGIRTASKNGGPGNLFQPGAILEMVVYQNPLKNLQRVKEYKFAVVYEEIFTSVLRNITAQYLLELFQKTINEAEPNENLYLFLEDNLLHLDRATENTAANMPLYFSLHLTGLLGFKLAENFSERRCFLDLQEGEFIEQPPHHPYYISGRLSELTSELLKVMHPEELEGFKLNKEIRRNLLDAYINFYRLHIHDFHKLNTIDVLKNMGL